MLLLIRNIRLMLVAVSSHESATFRGGGGHFCGRVARLATRQGLLHLSSRERMLLLIRNIRLMLGGVALRNVNRFRGGLVFTAHRLVYHSTLGLRVIKNKRRCWGELGARFRVSGRCAGKLHFDSLKCVLWHPVYSPRQRHLNPTPYAVLRWIPSKSHPSLTAPVRTSATSKSARALP